MRLHFHICMTEDIYSFTKKVGQVHGGMPPTPPHVLKVAPSCSSKAQVMTLLSGPNHDSQNPLAHVSLSFVSVGEWAAHSSASVCALFVHPSDPLPLNPSRSPEAPYMVRPHRSTIGCFYKSDNSVAGASFICRDR